LEERSASCDLLEKSYFCSITNNFGKWYIRKRPVVICLKNRTFAVSQTTLCWETRLCIWLWFAWKIVLLQYHKQPTAGRPINKNGCDLLEKSYFCSITNNLLLLFWINLKVVICLKNRTFAVSQTTGQTLHVYGRVLWFAWKIVLLQYHKQHVIILGERVTGCDLLEKSYFCSITNNHITNLSDTKIVVICLKNRTFAVSQTTTPHCDTSHPQLWFAWKIVLLQYHKQPALHLH